MALRGSYAKGGKGPQRKKNVVSLVWGSGSPKLISKKEVGQDRSSQPGSGGKPEEEGSFAPFQGPGAGARNGPIECSRKMRPLLLKGSR